METRAVARRHYERRQLLQRQVLNGAQAWWRSLDAMQLERTWLTVSDALLRLVTTGQALAAGQANEYLRTLTGEDGDGHVNAAAFAGVASDGRPLDTLLETSLTRAQALIAAGVAVDEAMLSGQAALIRIVTTQIADAGRVADGVALVAHRGVSGYVRMLNTPSCPRCVVLAGKYFRWNKGFPRHPRCDCLHIPANEDTATDLRTDPRAAIAAGQVTGLSAADTRAILEHGADVSQVINAHRGMYEARVFGRDIKGTLDATTVRGRAGKHLIDEGARLRGVTAETVNRLGRDGVVRRDVTRQRVQIPRLRPESIYELAGDDRDKALRLLRRFGYLQ